MQFPPYITEKQKKDTAKLYHEIRHRYGISQALIFKRLSMSMAYYQMFNLSKKYRDFLLEVKRYINNDTNKTFDGFWKIKEKADAQLNDEPAGYLIGVAAPATIVYGNDLYLILEILAWLEDISTMNKLMDSRKVKQVKQLFSQYYEDRK